MISDMTGMDISNASLLDEGTSAAEAMHVAYDQLRGKRNKFFASSRCHPQTLGVLKTRSELSGIELVVGDVEDMGDPSEYFGVLVQYPDTEGVVHDWHDFASEMKDNKVVVVAATDLLALTLLKSPGEWGADIAVGSAQRFGVPMFYGGPHAGFFACADKFKRKMPGRLIGLSRDADGNPGYRLAMQTREQHIRRDKATSNICTAQALLANCAASYAVFHGPKGLQEIAQRVTNMATCLRSGLNEIDGKERKVVVAAVVIDHVGNARCLTDVFSTLYCCCCCCCCCHLLYLDSVERLNKERVVDSKMNDVMHLW